MVLIKAHIEVATSGRNGRTMSRQGGPRGNTGLSGLSGDHKVPTKSFRDHHDKQVKVGHMVHFTNLAGEKETGHVSSIHRGSKSKKYHVVVQVPHGKHPVDMNHPIKRVD